MARDDDRERVAGAGRSDGPVRPRMSRRLCDLLVRAGLPVRYLGYGVQDVAEEIGARERQGQVELRPPSGQVFSDLMFGRTEHLGAALGHRIEVLAWQIYAHHISASVVRDAQRPDDR